MKTGGDLCNCPSSKEREMLSSSESHPLCRVNYSNDHALGSIHVAFMVLFLRQSQFDVERLGDTLEYLKDLFY